MLLYNRIKWPEDFDKHLHISEASQQTMSNILYESLLTPGVTAYSDSEESV